jgi:hypothetical protein
MHDMLEAIPFELPVLHDLAAVPGCPFGHSGPEAPFRVLRSRLRTEARRRSLPPQVPRRPPGGPLLRESPRPLSEPGGSATVSRFRPSVVRLPPDAGGTGAALPGFPPDYFRVD